MGRRAGIVFTVLVAVAAFVYTLIPASEPPEPFVIGKNNTVLFITNQEYGLSNVHLATAARLAELQPQVDIHYASFAPMKKKLDRAMPRGSKSSPGAKSFTFHQIDGVPAVERFDTAIGRTPGVINTLSHGTGLASRETTAKTMGLALCPWSAEEAYELYQQAVAVIERVDPAVVVLDMSFTPAWDATRDTNRAHTILTPNDLSTMFSDWQPRAGMLWKYPSWGTGISYPVPWSQIPLNAYLRIRSIISMATSPDIWPKYKYLVSKGVKNPFSFMSLYRKGVPWIAMSVPEASLPAVAPPGLTECGAIVLDAGRAEDQDAELAAWAKGGPTVLVNFGTIFVHDPASLLAMAEALDVVLGKTNVRVLWKVGKGGVKFQDKRFREIVDKWAAADRLRVVDWVRVEPVSLLMTGDVVLSVHHGGASSYYDAVMAGVPHMVLPQWSDHYIFAATAEYRGLGIWASKESAPAWNQQALATGFLEVLEGEKSESIRAKAKAVGEITRTYGGSKCAADIVAGMATN